MGAVAYVVRGNIIYSFLFVIHNYNNLAFAQDLVGLEVLPEGSQRFIRSITNNYHD